MNYTQLRNSSRLLVLGWCVVTTLGTACGGQLDATLAAMGGAGGTVTTTTQMFVSGGASTMQPIATGGATTTMTSTAPSAGAAGSAGVAPCVGIEVVEDTTVVCNGIEIELEAPATSCAYEAVSPSPDWVLDPEHVDIRYQYSGGERKEFPRLTSVAACDGSPNGGWYFDNPAAPESIQLCSCSCALVATNALQVLMIIGCSSPLEFE